MRTTTAAPRRRTLRDRGYAAIMTALVLVPLMGFAGFAVDVGAWYARASELSRAADAASLAGVVWQPDFGRAETAAREEAARNGFTHGVDGIEVNVSNTGNNELRVEIIDTSVDMYFAGLFLDNVAIGRQALAEYAAPVPMGSPANFIGAGSQSFGGVPASNAWAGMMGHCSNSRWGDLISLRTTDWSSSNCGSSANPYHDASGYRWVVDVPAGSSNVDIGVWDIGYCTDRASAGLSNGLRDKKDAQLRVTLYDKDSTPLTFEDNVTPSNMLAQYTGGVDEGCNAWSYSATHGLLITGGEGQYVVTTEILDGNGLQAYTDTAHYSGQQYFSLRANNAANPDGCLTFSSTSCPGIYADEWMPVRTDPTSSPAVFYLAEVGTEHAGKTLQVSMWDLGEGMKSVEVLDPLGNAMNFNWEVIYTVGGSTPSGNATNTNPNPLGGTCDLSSYCLFVTDAVFDGDLVEIQVPLPIDFSSYPNNWFSVRYTLITGETSVDWTTWGVQVIGDPVRLVE
ncbi:MAG: Tad domain-containing protein [Actinomycetota bacterium]